MRKMGWFFMRIGRKSGIKGQFHGFFSVFIFKKSNIASKNYIYIYSCSEEASEHNSIFIKIIGPIFDFLKIKSKKSSKIDKNWTFWGVNPQGIFPLFIFKKSNIAPKNYQCMYSCSEGPAEHNGIVIWFLGAIFDF